MKANVEKQRRPDFIYALVFIGDTIAIIQGLIIGFYLRFTSGLIPLYETSSASPELGSYLTLFGFGTLLMLMTLAYLQFYNNRIILNYRKSLLIILRSTAFWLVAYLSISLVLKFQPPISRTYALCSFCTTTIAIATWRWLFVQLMATIPGFAEPLRQRVLYYGWNSESRELIDVINTDPGHPYQVIGYVDTKEHVGIDIPYMGSLSQDLAPVLANHRIDILIAASSTISNEELVSIASLCDREYVQFKVIPSYFQILVSGLKLETLSGVPILGVEQLPLDRLTNRILKRIVDIIGSVVGLLLSAPLIAIFGLMVYLESPGTIFYRQTRSGRQGKNFEIIKIRSMRLNAEKGTGAKWAEENDPRRLRIGSFMRSWNIDEVPQFWNVLKGEMSLVGPRPERPELIDSFKHDIPHYNARHAAKPGITGWAQVNGLRGNTSLTDRVKFDLFYLENWTIIFDFQIMALTFIKRDNAY